MVYHPATVAKALEQFEADLLMSREVDLVKLQHRNIFSRTMESVCRLFSPVL